MRGEIPEGIGTALKPATEFCAVARKPLAGTVAANVQEWGTGALNIDACRVGTAGGGGNGLGSHFGALGNTLPLHKHGTDQVGTQGRWPPNCVWSHAPGCVQVGTRRVKGDKGSTRGGRESTEAWRMHHDTGQQIGYAGPDGTESVPAWECEPGCPVAELDRQSGTGKSPDKPVTQGGRKSVGGIMNATGDARNGLGRIGVGLDLSADYLRLATWRIWHSGDHAKAVSRTNLERQGSLL